MIHLNSVVDKKGSTLSITWVEILNNNPYFKNVQDLQFNNP